MMTKQPVDSRFPGSPNTLIRCRRIDRARKGVIRVTAQIVAALLLGVVPIATTVVAQEPGDTVVSEKGNPGVIAIPEEGGRYRILLRIVPETPHQVAEFTDTCATPGVGQAADADPAPQAESEEERGCLFAAFRLLGAFYRCEECKVSEGDVDVLLSFTRIRPTRRGEDAFRVRSHTDCLRSGPHAGR